MDPTNDPNFTPPSMHLPQPPPVPPSRVPYTPPINRPFVLADLGSAMDAPSPHPLLESRRSSQKSFSRPKLSAKIPMAETDLNSDSSLGSVDEDEPVFICAEDSSGINQELEARPELTNTYFDTEDRNSDFGDESVHKGFNMPTLPRVHSYQIADLEEVPHGVQRQANELHSYQFPDHRFATRMNDPSKHPLVIVACGSFSPITYLHLRMFEMAIDAVREQTKFEVIGGYFSPVSDNYKKRGLASSTHRVRMCELACERTSSWLMVDAWESLQPTYQRTALVLDHFNEEINVKRGGIAGKNGERKAVKIMLLAGGDLIESFGEPDVWADADVHHILGRYGCLIVERTGSDVRSFLLSHDIMYEHRRNVLVIKQLIYNDISSTKIRLFLRRGMSVQYLLPNSVIRYIQEHGLYIHESEPVKQVMSEKMV
ncbi:hypothetical protein BABINDRAFT_162271 [Babjeviella inositovora NRRL Y-12698]|uniref:Nicotinamide-nucleotide adenylyltransferase n=1 Tax=Babjeviella inositovora NRRL Y-12698 TaxID=984486 RepID=A0A1E3QNG9_9ASCO|nr:uncharacterized protein BABINDRAFT_162271 [Babjeviella inositovora NRRL Y-12698]ODQ79233.1 hypothetical protein BABINDRAFT_162271 [Babjeviella inositovora NRRL Y-12698]